MRNQIKKEPLSTNKKTIDTKTKIEITNKHFPYSKFNFKLIFADTEKILKNIDNNSLDLILTSPPYNIGKDYEKENALSISEYFAWQKEIITLCHKKLKESGSICWQVGYNNQNGTKENREYQPLEYEFHPIFKELGFIMKNRIIWAFGLGSQNRHNFSSRHEVIMWYVKSNKYTFNLENIRVLPKYPGKQSSLEFKKDGSRNEKYHQVSSTKGGKNPEDVWVDSMRSNFWEIPNVKSNHPEKVTEMKEVWKNKGTYFTKEEKAVPVHPCQFPTALTTRLILALTNEEDIVLDPFCGLGTTGVSCALTNRKFIGIDKDKKYLDIAKTRIDEALNSNHSHIREDKPVADHKKNYLWKDFDFEKWELRKKK